MKTEAPRGITPATRTAVLGATEDAAFCEYCGFPASEVDHIVPWSRGGRHDTENLAAACRECNREKRDLTVAEWAGARRAAGKPWPITHLVTRIQAVIASGVYELPDGNADVTAWMRSLPGGYEGLRGRLTELRDVALPATPEQLALFPSPGLGDLRRAVVAARLAELGGGDHAA